MVINNLNPTTIERKNIIEYYITALNLKNYFILIFEIMLDFFVSFES